MAYRLTEQAIEDLDEIDDFVANRSSNVQGAQIVEDYLFAAFERIGIDPKLCGGHLRPDLTTKPVKFLTVRRYMVVYDDSTDPVIILAIAGGRQDLHRLLARDPRFNTSDGD